MSNTGSTKVLTAGKSLFKVLQREILLVKLDTTYANKATINFESKTPLSFINIIRVDISVGTANFNIINALIPFLLDLKDINILMVYPKKITN